MSNWWRRFWWKLLRRHSPELINLLDFHSAPHWFEHNMAYVLFTNKNCLHTIIFCAYSWTFVCAWFFLEDTLLPEKYLLTSLLSYLFSWRRYLPWSDDLSCLWKNTFKGEVLDESQILNNVFVVKFCSLQWNSDEILIVTYKRKELNKIALDSSCFMLTVYVTFVIKSIKIIFIKKVNMVNSHFLLQNAVLKGLKYYMHDIFGVMNPLFC